MLLYNMIIISIYLILLLFLMLFILLIFSMNFIFSLNLMDWMFFNLKMNFYFDSMIFSFILLLVTSSVLIFSSYYLMGEINFSYYLMMLLIFVLSMFMLNFSYNSFSMLISWDLLGISSFFLVLFYNNWDSCSGSMNTVLTNRLGDFFLFIFFSTSVFSGMSMISYSFMFWSSLMFLILTAFTKSAQFPFSGWLPKAMSAPTPVSSLVHSSTLVTAGLLLLFNFNLMLMNSFSMGLIFFIGLFTTLFSSVSALLEEDLKKVVALSTLSQMGFSMMTFGLGMYFISLMHLLSHALFKSCLFIQVGYLIHCSFGQQDGRFYSVLKFSPIFVQIQLLVTLFCLCGLFFTSGLVSKDIILEFFFFNKNYFFISLLFFFIVYLTFFYSYRLWKSLFNNFSNVFIHYSSSFLINFLSMFLCLFSIFFIWWMNYNLVNLPSFFIYFDFFIPLIYLFLFLFISMFLLKFILIDLVYKFLGDYFPKLLNFNMNNLKFSENFLFSFSKFNISFFINMSNYFNFYLYSNYFNSVVLIFFLLFLIL